MQLGKSNKWGSGGFQIERDLGAPIKFEKLRTA
jgi:hypothetical protein